MENLESASVVEMTSELTKIKSDYLIIKDNDNKYLQLGIKNIGYEDVFETILISSDNIYFKDTTINEKIVSIEKYNDNFELEPFSFRENNEVCKELPDKKSNGLIQEEKKIDSKIQMVKSSNERPSLIGRLKKNKELLSIENQEEKLDKNIQKSDIK